MQQLFQFEFAGNLSKSCGRAPEHSTIGWPAIEQSMPSCGYSILLIFSSSFNEVFPALGHPVDWLVTKTEEHISVHLCSSTNAIAQAHPSFFSKNMMDS